MADRVTSYRQGRQAIADLKACLATMISHVPMAGSAPPVVIIIDELDRCRPTYAIKLLEEIKHLFDVAGLIFIFGMHGQQLAHSVNAAYGANFDGASYLKRFMKRRYTLKEANQTAYIRSLLSRTAITENDFECYHRKDGGSHRTKPSLAEQISEYLHVYDLSARDAIELIDILSTCASISKNKYLIAPLLIPIAIGSMKNLPKGTLPAAVRPARWQYHVSHNRSTSDIYTLPQIADHLYAAATYSYETLCELEERDAFCDAALHSYGPTGHAGIDSMQRYSELVSMVARIQRPGLIA